MLQCNIYLLLTWSYSTYIPETFSLPPIVCICYYLGTVNPFYSFYNNLLDFYLTSYYRQFSCNLTT